MPATDYDLMRIVFWDPARSHLVAYFAGRSALSGREHGVSRCLLGCINMLFESRATFNEAIFSMSSCMARMRASLVETCRVLLCCTGQTANKYGCTNCVALLNPGRDDLVILALVWFLLVVWFWASPFLWNLVLKERLWCGC
jgi:hypothetical protein